MDEPIKRGRGRPMGKLHQEDVRKKIAVAQLIKVLTDQALGVSADLSPARLKAIEILLRKSLPDLTAVEMTGADGGPLQTQVIERRVIDHAVIDVERPAGLNATH